MNIDEDNGRVNGLNANDNTIKLNKTVFEEEDNIDNHIKPDQNCQTNQFLKKDILFNKEINVDYSEIDPQKGCNSPRDLFKPILDSRLNQKIAINSNYFNYTINNFNQLKEGTEPPTIKELINSDKDISKFILYEHYTENYLDFVNETYFTSIENTDPEEEKRFKFTSLDFLLNPLRTPLPFEKWSPYEIALFESCICKYGKDFELFIQIIKTKNLGEIQEFYYTWEKSKYYSAWVATQIKKGKYPTKLF